MNALAAASVIICYAMTPNAYLTDHAAELAGLYDGYYFVCGSWESGVEARLGFGMEPPADREWLNLAEDNVAALKAEGMDQNLLGVHFESNGTWPSPRALLSEAYTDTMERNFGRLAQAARARGFVGVAIDVEYPYPRYDLDHEIYTYDGYTPADLIDAAYHQGRVIMGAILYEFPEAVVFVLPGTIRAQPINGAFMRGMLERMAEHQAPGGFHLAAETAYSLWDPVTQAAIPREDDGWLETHLGSPIVLDYWKRHCSIAPGVWPLHMVETGSSHYEQRPWAEELAELRQQMSILKATTKQYLWSYTGAAAWHVPDGPPERAAGRSIPDFEGAMEAITGWHDILRTAKSYTELDEQDPRMLRLISAVRGYDTGELTIDELCDAFGTPSQWNVLGPLSNPFVDPPRAAPDAWEDDVNPLRVYYGRDGAVRWFPHVVRAPTGLFEMRTVLDYLHTDDASLHLVCWVESDTERQGLLNVAWDDGMIVRLGDETVFDHPQYPERGKGWITGDRYFFEESIPVTIPAGTTRLSVTSINSHGKWTYTLRFTDSDGYPLKGLHFRITED